MTPLPMPRASTPGPGPGSPRSIRNGLLGAGFVGLGVGGAVQNQNQGQGQNGRVNGQGAGQGEVFGELGEYGEMFPRRDVNGSVTGLAG